MKGSELSASIVADLHWASSFPSTVSQGESFHYIVPFPLHLSSCLLSLSSVSAIHNVDASLPVLDKFALDFAEVSFQIAQTRLLLLYPAKFRT